MKYRLEILRRDTSPGTTGARAERFEPVRTVHAERVKLTGRVVTEAGDIFPDYHVEFNIRNVHPVEEGWHVRQLGGHEYVVNSIIPNLDRGMNTLVCERFNT